MARRNPKNPILRRYRRHITSLIGVSSKEAGKRSSGEAGRVTIKQFDLIESLAEQLELRGKAAKVARYVDSAGMAPGMAIAVTEEDKQVSITDLNDGQADWRSDVSPITERLIDATREGSLAWRSGSARSDNPHRTYIEWSAWEMGFREARSRAARQMVSDLGVGPNDDEEKDQD